MKVLIKADFPEALNSNIESSKKIEVIIDDFILQYLTPVPDDTVRIFLTSQPEGNFNEVIKSHQHCFTYLLTQQAELLTLPNAHLFISPGSFVDPNPDIKKRFAVSTVITGRNCLPGHALRHELYVRRKEINIPFDIYFGTWMPPGYDDPEAKHLDWGVGQGRKDKAKAMDCMFHIAIDSFRRENHISEKLIDPLITKTIPLYWGCTNLSDYFNTDGIIQVATVNEIIYLTNLLTQAFYYDSIASVKDNYFRALKYHKYEDLLRSAILKITKI